MSLFKEVVIKIEIVDLSHEIVCTNNIDYVGCDYRTCYFVCAKGVTFQNVIVERFRWLNVEKPCA